MKCLFKKSFVVMILGLLFCHAAWAQSAIRIDSVATLDRRMPIAIPDCVPAVGLQSAAREFADVITYDLEFSGLFAVLTRSEYPEGIKPHTRDVAKIDFNPWRKTNVENITHIYIYEAGVKLVAECRLYDVMTGRQVIGNRLSEERTNLRKIAHTFSEEIIRALEGTHGIGTSEICFSLGKTGKKELYISDYDGANLKQLTRHGSISILPELSPDGRKVAYLSYKERYPFLYILDIDSGKTSALSKKVGLNVSPAWAPDGSRLALVLSKDGNPEIYLSNPDGKGLKRLTRDKSADTSPTFDPTGTKIAFVSDRGGYPQIFTMNTNGKDIRRVSFQGGTSCDPAWSPDGKRIAYVVEKGGEGREIYVMDTDGRNYRRLTNSYGGNESPSWSADSRHIVYSSTRGGVANLFAINTETLEEKRIPRLPGDCQGPSWGPRRRPRVVQGKK